MHSIQKQNFNIQCESDGVVQILQNQLYNFSYRKLLPAIEQIADELCPPDKIIRIENITIDLGKISLDYWESELEDKFIQAFRRALEEAIASALIKDNPRPKVLDAKQSGLKLFQYILEEGIYPWWAQTTWAMLRDNQSDTISVEKLYNYLWELDAWALIECIRRYHNNPVILLRLIRQLKEAQLWASLQLVFPNEINFLKGLWAELLQLYKKINPAKWSFRAFYETFWQSLLGYLFSLNAKLSANKKEELRNLLIKAFPFLENGLISAAKFGAFTLSASSIQEIEKKINQYWQNQWPEKKDILEEFIQLSRSKFQNLEHRDILLTVFDRLSMYSAHSAEISSILKDILLDLLLKNPVSHTELSEFTQKIPELKEISAEWQTLKQNLPHQLEHIAELIQTSLQAMIQGLMGKKKLDLAPNQVGTSLIEFLRDDKLPTYHSKDLKYLALFHPLPQEIDSKVQKELQKIIQKEREILIAGMIELLENRAARQHLTKNLDSEQLQVLIFHLDKRWGTWGANLSQEIVQFRNLYMRSHISQQALHTFFWSTVIEKIFVDQKVSLNVLQESLIKSLINRLALRVPTSDTNFWKHLSQGLPSATFKILSKYARISPQTLAQKDEQGIILNTFKTSPNLGSFLSAYSPEEYPKLLQTIIPNLADFYIQLILASQEVSQQKKYFFQLIWQNIWANKNTNAPQKHYEGLIKKMFLFTEKESEISFAFSEVLLNQVDLRETAPSLAQNLLAWASAHPASSALIIAWAEAIPELSQRFLHIAERQAELFENNSALFRWVNQKKINDPLWREKARLKAERDKVQTYFKKPITTFKIGEIIYVTNAGLILIHPFIRRLFDLLEYTEKRKFKNSALQHRAVHALQYVVNKHLEADEPSLVLNKILCGMDIGDPLASDIELNQEEKEICDKMLLGLIAQWSILKGVTPDSLRAAFLIRDGRLKDVDEFWELIVEKKGIDILLEHIPWSISTIQFHWMKKVMHIVWG